MKLFLLFFLKTRSMKPQWKKVVMYILRLIELIISGAAGGTISQL